MNRFNKTEAAILPMKDMLFEDFPISPINQHRYRSYQRQQYLEFVIFLFLENVIKLETTLAMSFKKLTDLKTISMSDVICREIEN